MPNLGDISDPTTAMNMALILMLVGGNDWNQFRQFVGQSEGNQIRNQNGHIVVQGMANQNANQNENDNVVVAQAKGNGNGNNGDIDEIEKDNANCILMANLQQASTSGT
ncbi:hypothetical protein Tco_0129819 [Tanacetum coccineum]